MERRLPGVAPAGAGEQEKITHNPGAVPLPSYLKQGYFRSSNSLNRTNRVYTSRVMAPMAVE